MKKPLALKAGDTVAAITLSWGGAGKIPQRYEAGKEQLEKAFKLKAVPTENALRSAEWIYQNPKARADDLMAAFRDSNIKAIISTIGGDESVRLLPYLDLEVIAQNPKIFLGYSDTTVMHFVCYKAGLTSFYGPSIMSGFAENGGLFPYMEESVRKTLFETTPVGVIEPNRAGWTVEHLNWADPENQKIKRTLRAPTGPKLLQGSGKVQGHLLGGCLEVMEMLKGTAFWPTLEQWMGAILFIETSEEAPDVENVKRWIRNYGSQGILEVINGIILGRPGGNLSEDKMFQYDDALKTVIVDELGLKDLPIMTQMDFGHTDPMFVIPYGVQAEMDCTNNRFSIIESGVL